ncbi:MAG: hypothetical protein JNM78_05835 [Cyclobacteriaceae bacterium]|nr:hypothetical protein [Cyclobacteriaceae bacterium]
MKRLKSLKEVGALFQAVAVLLILFYSPPVYSYTKNNPTSDTVLLCLVPSSVVASREANPSLPFTFSLVQINFLQEENWRLTALLHSAELKTCLALGIPSSLYNTYYQVPRIHAP